MLSREEILSKVILQKELINIPEWGGDIYVTEMSGCARDAWEQTLIQKDDKGRLIAPRAKLIIATVVDENGERLFTDNDIDAIGKLSAGALEKICDIAQKLNFLQVADLEKKKKN